MSDELPPTAEWAKHTPARRFRIGMNPVPRYQIAERERDEAEARLAEALAALEFYAAPDSWQPHRTEQSIASTGVNSTPTWRSVTPVQDDRGERARAVLAAGQPARQGEATCMCKDASSACGFCLGGIAP